jgi:hypothetical protein
MKSAVFALFVALILSACATGGGKMNDLREGMTKDEVFKVAGGPDGYQRSGDYEVLFYLERRTSAWSYFAGAIQDLVDYSVVLKDDRVIEYGPGRAQQREVSGTPFVRVPSR